MNTLANIQRHVVAQIVKAKFVVRAISNITGVGGLFLRCALACVDHTDTQTQCLVQRAHPFRVTTRQIVVYRDHVDPIARDRVEVDRQGRYQGFTLTGAHFCNTPVVQGHTADHLNIKVTHPHDAYGYLAANRKGLGQDFV